MLPEVTQFSPQIFERVAKTMLARIRGTLPDAGGGLVFTEALIDLEKQKRGIPR